MNEMRALPAEIQLSIQSIIKRELEGLISGRIQELVQSEMLSIKRAQEDTAYQLTSERMKSIGDDQIYQFFKTNIDGYVHSLTSRMKAIEDNQGELLRFRMPEFYHKAILDLQSTVNEIAPALQRLDTKMTNIIVGKFVENPSDEELQDLYKKSRIPLKKIADEFKVEAPRAHQLVNGKVKDTATRAKLKLMMVREIESKLAVVK